MQKRTLGKTDLTLPVVSFGAWAIGGWMWGGSDDKDAINGIHAAVDSGITCIDTAPIYGMGHSEEVVGKAISDRRDKVEIATKCGLRWDQEEGEFFFDTKDPQGKSRKVYRCLRKASIKHECDVSLQRLGTDVIDLYQAHWPDSTTPISEMMEAFSELQQEGKIRAYGVSNFTVDMMQECQKHGQIASDQPKYNALERGIENDVLPFCREQQIGILAYSPIAQGLLTGKVTLDREFPQDDVRHGQPMFKKENRKKVLDMLERVKPIADKHDATYAQLFIAWLVAQPGVTTALVGARNPKQAQENAKAGTITLGDDDVQAIRKEVESLGPLE